MKYSVIKCVSSYRSDMVYWYITPVRANLNLIKSNASFYKCRKLSNVKVPCHSAICIPESSSIGDFFSPTHFSCPLIPMQLE